MARVGSLLGANIQGLHLGFLLGPGNYLAVAPPADVPVRQPPLFPRCRLCCLLALLAVLALLALLAFLALLALPAMLSLLALLALLA